MSTLQVIAVFLELEHAIRNLVATDDVSKNLRTLLEDTCTQHHKSLLRTLAVDFRQPTRPPTGSAANAGSRV